MLSKKDKFLSMIFIFTIIITTFSTILVANATSNTYYVSASGSDSNNGLSLSSPFATIQKAVDTVQAGDTVSVRAGTYNEAITIGTSGTSSQPITFQNYNGETAIIDGTNLSVEAGVLISSKNYIIFNGFMVQNFTSNTSETITGIRVNGNSKGIEIRNCKIHDIKTTYSGSSTDRNAHGIAVYGTVNNVNDPIDGLILDNNEVYNCLLGQSESVVINGNVSNFTVTNNIVHDNDNIGIDFIGFEGNANDDVAGVSTAMQDRARNGVCTDNYVYNITSANNPTYSDSCADGLYVDGGYNIILERNVVDNCDIGIEAASEHSGCTTDQITIRNNLVTNCRAVGGISFGGASSSNGDAKNVKIYNNTLYNNEPNINISNANSSTNVVKNNICYTGTYVGGTIGNNVVSNNLTTNPGFVNASSKDFQLQAGSAAIDAGVVVDYGSTDLNSNTRVVGNAVDYGAYEYQSGGQTPTAPVISNVQITDITTNSATVTWTTDQSSSSVVEYGTTTSYGSSITGSGRVTSHSATLSGLSASTTYHYRVTSTNSSNLTIVSSDDTFTTSANTQTEVTVDDDNSAITYGSGWAVYADSGDSGGSHHEVNSANKYASFTFSGTSIKWISQKDNNYGKAYVYIDNVKVSTVDLYASSTTYQQEVYSNQSLSNGSHTIKIVCTGTKNSSSSNKYVTIDAFKYNT